MNIRETIDEIKKNITAISFISDYHSSSIDKPHFAKNLIALKDAVRKLDGIPFIEKQITTLKESALFENYRDEDVFSSGQNSLITSTVRELSIGLNFLLSYYYSSNKFEEDVIHIKFPEVNTFEDLSKLTNELKRAIELPINESNTEGRVNIITAENGSIWLIVSLGTIAAVNMIAGICWAAAVIRKKNAEAKIFEAHVKTLELKNDAIDSLINAQKKQLNNILTAEAEAILLKHFDSKDPEVLNRLKLSVTTVADLIERGTKILPNSESDDIKKLFPDYNNLNLIASTIKQLSVEQN